MLSYCDGLTDQERKKDLGAFFKSIHGTLNHILLSDRAWMGRFKNEPVQVGYMSQGLFEDYEDLKKERAKTDQAIIHWVETLTEETLRKDFTYTSAVDTITRTLPYWSCALHFFNHQTHHRGQITTLMKQLGLDPGIMDIPWTPGLAIIKGE